MEYQNLITRKTNLQNNDSLTIYDGWPAQQNPYAFELFFNFIKKVRPSRIIEIGTSLGGFTKFLNSTCKKLGIDCKVVTYDIYNKNEYTTLIKEGIDVKIENIFNSNYTSLKEDVINFIKDPGVTIVLCDGGDKIREFNLISNYLKVGDFILAHDYAENKKIFENEVHMKLWNWHEISESDIKSACDKNNLHDYERENFKLGVWVCKIKK